MLRSWLLRFSLLIALATIEVGANCNTGELGTDSVFVRAAQLPHGDQPKLHKRIEHVVAEKETELEKLLLERTPESPSSPRERASPALGIPEPTAPPQRRQDDGQIQGLSSQLQSLSSSATQAISSVSSSASSAISQISQSAQSIRQSADQAVQSANQNADDANRQLSQTQSSASSAISAATSRASSQISQSLSSMSSRIALNMASAQSSASSAVSAAQVEASQFAASQVQEARADASGVRGDADSLVSQVQANSISGTNVAIIVSAAVVGTAILSTVLSCLIVRCRHKKRRAREAEAAAVGLNEKPPEKPIAVRGTPNSPRFTPFGGGTGYPMDKFKLPVLTPIKRKKVNEDSRANVGFAVSDYSNEGGDTKAQSFGGKGDGNADVYGVSPSSFRLQKPTGTVKSATSVRLIRVGSDKDKSKAETNHPPRTPPSPMSPPPPAPPQVAAAVAAAYPEPLSPPPTQPLPPTPSAITQPPKAQQSPPKPRYPRESTHSTTRDSEADMPGWRPPTMTSQRRLKFRDSSDIESAEPTPTTNGWRSSSIRNTMTSMRNTNTASLRTSPPDSSSRSPPRVRPQTTAAASFTTFPKVRAGPARGSAAASVADSIISRGRPGLGPGLQARLRGEADRRRTELAGFAGGGRPQGGNRENDRLRSSREFFSGDALRTAAWPFEGR
ncbi:Uu.00g074440.m01.CDS01 [Anthostomella pinea]|uniref:Uu.00g074440.m01.CDS01 n=1 Tax=Anthostomella pinea TaxID=933095 RepID=A0AAI8VW74_9PEZI|nr:Uu.00g074440.m01.CDS01 [Anthostomella pinea]